jgi:hypothetical protein
VTPKKNPQENILKAPPQKPQQRAPKITRKKDRKATHNLEEPRRIIYTYHEGSYKV